VANALPLNELSVLLLDGSVRQLLNENVPFHELISRRLRAKNNSSHLTFSDLNGMIGQMKRNVTS
jgi:hypothetical protein